MELYGIIFYYIRFRSYKNVQFGKLWKVSACFSLKLHLNSCLKNCSYSLPNKVTVIM